MMFIDLLMLHCWGQSSLSDFSGVGLDSICYYLVEKLHICVPMDIDIFFHVMLWFSFDIKTKCWAPEEFGRVPSGSKFSNKKCWRYFHFECFVEFAGGAVKSGTSR